MAKLTKSEVQIVLEGLIIQENIEPDGSMEEEKMSSMRSAFDSAMERYLQDKAPVLREKMPPGASIANSVRLVVRNLGKLLVGPSLSPSLRAAQTDDSSTVTDQHLPIQIECRHGTDESTLRVRFDPGLPLAAIKESSVTVVVNGEVHRVKWIDSYDATLDVYIEGELSGQLTSAEAVVSGEFKVLISLRVEPLPTP